MTLFKRILKSLGLLFLILTLNPLPLALHQLLQGTSMAVQLLGTLLGMALVGVILILLWRRYIKDEPSSASRFTRQDLAFVLVYWLLGRLIAIGGSQLNQALFGQDMSGNDQAIVQMIEALSKDSLPLFVFLLLSIAVFGPVLEELVFRGFLPRYFPKASPAWLPMVVTSTIFGVLHLNVAPNLVEFGMYFSLGLLLYHCFARRGNLRDAILFHIINNAPIAVALGLEALLA